MKELKIREFNTRDWGKMPEAEHFEGYDWDTDEEKMEEPLVCDSFENTSCTIVADGCGIQLIRENCVTLKLDNDCPDWEQEFAKEILEGIVEDIDTCTTDEEVETLLREKYEFETVL